MGKVLAWGICSPALTQYLGKEAGESVMAKQGRAVERAVSGVGVAVRQSLLPLLTLSLQMLSSLLSKSLWSSRFSPLGLSSSRLSLSIDRTASLLLSCHSLLSALVPALQDFRSFFLWVSKSLCPSSILYPLSSILCPCPSLI